MTYLAPSIAHNHIMHLIFYLPRNAIPGYLLMRSFMNSSHVQYGPLCRSRAALLLTLCALFPQFTNHGLYQLRSAIDNRSVITKRITHRQCFGVDAILDQGHAQRQCVSVQMCVLFTVVVISSRDGARKGRRNIQAVERFLQGCQLPLVQLGAWMLIRRWAFCWGKSWVREAYSVQISLT